MQAPVSTSDGPTAVTRLEPALQDCFRRALDTYNGSSESRLFNQLETEDELRRRQLALIHRHLPASGRLLDIGTGTGVVPHAIQLLGHEVISVDHPITGGTRALRRLEALGIRSVYAQVGVERLPLATNSMDVVFAGDVIEHQVNSPKPFLQELVRVLRPRGTLIMSTPNATRLTVRAKVLAGYSNWPALDDFYEAGAHIGHHKEYTRGELLSVLSRAGIEDVTLDLVEVRIPATPVAGLRDLHTQSRFGQDLPRARGPRSLLIEGARSLAMACIRLRPALASELIAWGRKTGNGMLPGGWQGS